MAAPQPITLVSVDAEDYAGSAPKPFAVVGGVPAGTVAWADVTGKPTLLTVGTTASTAKAGNYTPTSAEVSTALKAKAQVTALAAVSAANAAPAVGTEPTKAEYDVLVTLANANKVAINAIIAALKA